MRQVCVFCIAFFNLNPDIAFCTWYVHTLFPSTSLALACHISEGKPEEPEQPTAPTQSEIELELVFRCSLDFAVFWGGFLRVLGQDVLNPCGDFLRLFRTWGSVDWGEDLNNRVLPDFTSSIRAKCVSSRHGEFGAQTAVLFLLLHSLCPGDTVSAASRQDCTKQLERLWKKLCQIAYLWRVAGSKILEAPKGPPSNGHLRDHFTQKDYRINSKTISVR